ncbi:zinc-ribbon domain-containing protein [Christiangramia flava]|uniref:zinc-ribbon domain-containing protein n=1 Tax=Christiangramia flava TaxID=1486245 RepID=UPI0009F96FD0
MGLLKYLFRGSGYRGHHSLGHHNKRGYGNREDNSGSKVMICCTACGKKNDENAAFCQKCGSPLGKSTCSNCKESVPIGAKFCPNCGTGLN